MFLGHFALAIAAKPLAPRTSLGTLVAAAQLADLVWPALLLLGTERAAVSADPHAIKPLVFIDYPWSHSLLTLAGLGALFGMGNYLLRGDARVAIAIALLVPSHWLLDWIAHVPDLPLYPGTEAHHGLGLWRWPVATLLLELALFALAAALYGLTTRPRDRTGRWAWIALTAVLVAIAVADVSGRPPPDIRAVAYAGLGMSLFVVWAAWIDRHRCHLGESFRSCA